MCWIDLRATQFETRRFRRTLPIPLNLDEVEILLKDLAKHESAEAADYFEFAFFSGLRASEQIALRWVDHDRGKGLLRVQRARVWGQDKPTTKTHHVRSEVPSIFRLPRARHHAAVLRSC